MTSPAPRAYAPLSHTRTFRVRFSECDAYGHLNNTHYLRYMQETAFDATAAAGYDMERYRAMQRIWLAHMTEIEYLQPLRYNDLIEVKTWVVDFRRVSSRRAYQFSRVGTGELVARAHTDWAFINTETDQPAPIPDEMAGAFFPDGLPPAWPERERFTTPPEAPPGVFSIRRRVAWRDIDSAFIVNNPVYLDYVEDCGFQAVAAHGWPVTRMVAEGLAIILRKHQVRYLLPARYDEELEISTWVSAVKRSTATRHYTIRRAEDGTLLCQVNTLGVWIDLGSYRPVRIPQEMLADFAPNIVS